MSCRTEMHRRHFSRGADLFFKVDLQVCFSIVRWYEDISMMFIDAFVFFWILPRRLLCLSTGRSAFLEKIRSKIYLRDNNTTFTRPLLSCYQYVRMLWNWKSFFKSIFVGHTLSFRTFKNTWNICILLFFLKLFYIYIFCTFSSILFVMRLIYWD